MTATETKHTPGPWKVGDVQYSHNIGEYQCIYGSPNKHNVVEIVCHTWPNSSFSQQADARLIAAAPELLAACIKARDDMEGQGVYDIAALHALEAAIAKAT